MYTEAMKSIAVIFGGKSAEHDVSIITAHTPIIDTLLASGEYDVWPVYITTDGDWYSDKAMNDLAFFKKDGWEETVRSWKKVELSFDGGLVFKWPGLLGKSVKIDIVFPSMHGTYGEDGSLMGLLRMAGVPFVGCDIFGSAVAMDKVLTKQVVAAEGMAVVPYVWFTKAQWVEDPAKYHAEIKKLKYPLFVKPVHLGSSIGIGKVKNDDELENAIEVALTTTIKSSSKKASTRFLRSRFPSWATIMSAPPSASVRSTRRSSSISKINTFRAAERKAAEKGETA
jgi:D-alanine-D-alanine ligase